MHIYANYFAFLVLLASGGTLGENLYLEQVNQAQPTEKELNEVRTQLEEHKIIEINNDSSIAAFHKRDKLENPKIKSLCLTCHIPLPHQNKLRSRAFLNMHSQYIACETCHFKPEEEQLEYHWIAYDDNNHGGKIEVLTEVLENLDNHTGSIQPKADARIAPFYLNNPIPLYEDSKAAQDFIHTWKNGSESDKITLKAKLHIPLNNTGLACENCHHDKHDSGFLNFANLGANQSQIFDIHNKIIAKFFRRYSNDDEKIRLNELLGEREME